MPRINAGAWVVTGKGSGRIIDRFWRDGSWWYTVRSELSTPYNERAMFDVIESDIIAAE